MSSRLKRFALVSFIGAVVLLLALVLFFRSLGSSNLSYHNNQHNIVLSQLFKNTLMQYGLPELLNVNTGAQPDTKTSQSKIVTAFEQQLTRQLQDLPVIKLKLYDRNGRVAYSSVKDDIGKKAELLDIFTRVNKGETINLMKYRKNFQLENKALHDIYVLESYVPVRSDDGNILGVFEIYSDVSGSIQQNSVLEIRMILGVVLILGASYGILFWIFYRTDKQLQREATERSDYLSEIEKINNELELRVRKRTQDIESARYFLQSIIDGIADPVMVIDMDLKVIEVNQANRNLIPEQDDIRDYQYCYQISHRINTPCNGELHPCSFNKVLETGATCKLMHTHYNEKGEPIYVEVTSTPLRDVNGKLIGIIEVAHDVTDVIQAKNQLQESQQRIRSIMDTVNSAILAVNDQGIIQDCNPAAEKLFRYKSGEIPGYAVAELLGESLCLEAMNTENLFNAREVKITRPDDTHVPVEIWVGRAAVADSNLTIIVLQDISQRKKAEQELVQTQQQYFHSEKMAAIGQLAAGILHEVGNPIASISGALQVINTIHSEGKCKGRECQIKDEVVSNIALIEQQISRLSGITREIADFTSPRMGKYELLDLNGLIKNTVKLMRYDKRFIGIELKMELEFSLPAINGVADQLIQVIMNLIVNAFDACEACEISSSRASVIIIKTQLNAQEIQVIVEDNCTGMEAEVLQRSREAFFTTKPVGKGSGLGLSLCDAIMLKHKGRLTINSTPDQGTRVSLFFPVEI